MDKVYIYEFHRLRTDSRVSGVQVNDNDGARYPGSDWYCSGFETPLGKKIETVMTTSTKKYPPIIYYYHRESTGSRMKRVLMMGEANWRHYRPGPGWKVERVELLK